MKSLTFSCLICALNLYFAQNPLRKTKKFIEPQKVAPNSKSCSKVPEHNLDRPTVRDFPRWDMYDTCHQRPSRWRGIGHLSPKLIKQCVLFEQ